MKSSITICTTSFTMVMIVAAIIDHIDSIFAPDITSITILQFFSMSLTISILIHLFRKIYTKVTNRSNIPWIILILICYITVLLLGTLYGYFSLSFEALLIITPIMIPTFIVTSLIEYITISKYANEINREISKRK